MVDQADFGRVKGAKDDLSSAVNCKLERKLDAHFTISENGMLVVLFNTRGHTVSHSKFSYSQMCLQKMVHCANIFFSQNQLHSRKE